MSKQKNINNNNETAETISNRRDRVISTRNRWRSLNVNIYLYMLIGLLLFLGSCQAAQAMGWWSTSGKTTSTGEKITATGTDPSEIKGWMTVKEVIEAYDVSWEEFSTQFDIPADTPLTTPLKDLENITPGFSVDSVRTWLTERMKK